MIIKRLNKQRKFFIFSATVLRFSDLLAGWKLAINAKFQLNISDIMPG